MSESRSVRVPVGSGPCPADSSGLVASWLRFWFTPTDPIGLHVVRLLSGLVFLAWLLPLAGNLDSLFGQQGWFDLQAFADTAQLRGAYPRMGDDAALPFGWSLLFCIGSHSGPLTLFYAFAIVVVVLFTLGIVVRVTSILTWVILVSFTANPVLESDGDVLVRLLSMYLMVGYVLLDRSAPGLSLWSRLLGSRDSFLLGRSPARPCRWTNLALRLLQVHLVIVVLTSAMHKLQFVDWWTGFALWYPAHGLSSPFQLRQMMPYRNLYMNIYSLASYIVLAWQFGLAFFAWRPRWRMLLLGGAALAWLASAWLYQVPVFGPAFAVCCLSFVTPDEWHRWLGQLRRVPGLAAVTRWLPIEGNVRTQYMSNKHAAASLATKGKL